jgi:LmbE family N-acetylglucosaminyl deacetylase
MPALGGAPESLWQLALEQEQGLEMTCAAIVVSPHLDHEVLSASDLIREAAQAAHDVTVLSVTDGEAYPDWRGLGEGHAALAQSLPWRRVSGSRHAGFRIDSWRRAP